MPHWVLVLPWESHVCTLMYSIARHPRHVGPDRLTVRSAFLVFFLCLFRTVAPQDVVHRLRGLHRSAEADASRQSGLVGRLECTVGRVAVLNWLGTEVEALLLAISWSTQERSKYRP